MTDHQCRTHTDIQTGTLLELACNHRFCCIRDRKQTLDKQTGNTRDQLHYGTHLYSQHQHFRQVITGQSTDTAADHNTEEKRLSHQTELLFHSFRVDIDLVYAGDFVEALVDGPGKRHEACTEGLRNRDSVHFVIELLELGRCKIGDNQRNDVADNRSEESPQQAVCCEICQRTDKSEMPVVPQVDIDRFGGFGQQHQDINTQADRNNKCTYRGIVSDTGRSRPPHVEDFELQPVDIDHSIQSRTKRTGQQRRNDRETYETDANKQTAFEGFTELDADTNAQHSKDDGHHHGCTQPHDITEYFFHKFCSKGLHELTTTGGQGP